MTTQGTLGLDAAEDHDSPFACDDDDGDDGETEREERTGTTLADFGAAGQATVDGFGGGE